MTSVNVAHHGSKYILSQTPPHPHPYNYKDEPGLTNLNLLPPALIYMYARDFSSLVPRPLPAIQCYNVGKLGVAWGRGYHLLLHIQVGTPRQMTSRNGKPLKKCEVKLMDDGCASFSLLL